MWPFNVKKTVCLKILLNPIFCLQNKIVFYIFKKNALFLIII